ncbi:MAG TPA: hypothetical protein VK453_10545 [Micromonosporaceae bacterium]|nr:hypothetical protein [Micromonosporaceae bacterium]
MTLLLYPLWWALGLGVLIFFVAAVPMAVILLHRHRRGYALRLPPAFILWLIFLAVVATGIFTLGADPAGTVPGTATSRLVPYAYRLGAYLALTILLLFAGNLDERELPQRRLVGLLGWLFGVTVCGGVLGGMYGTFEFVSPVEALLPTSLREMGFVRSLVHPSLAQVMDILGTGHPRPAAPWGYTNTWGNNVCLLVGWFVVAAWAYPRRRLARLAALGCLAIATVPIVYSLNRGLWIGLAVTTCYVAVRLVPRGRYAALGALAVVATTFAVALAVTPLGHVVEQRLAHAKSNGVRLYTTEHAISGLTQSPLIGFGSTRNTEGGRHSIAIGESPDCERCGNFTVGGNGQLWQLLFAHGLIGTVAYLGFFGYGLWRFRHDTSPLGLAGSAAIVSSFAAMFWYNALVTPLALLMCGYALLWRSHWTVTRGRDRARPDTAAGRHRRLDQGVHP